MKRTKETYFREHPDWNVRQGVSGLRDFDGEDLRMAFIIIFSYYAKTRKVIVEFIFQFLNIFNIIIHRIRISSAIL